MLDGRIARNQRQQKITLSIENLSMTSALNPGRLLFDEKWFSRIASLFRTHHSAKIFTPFPRKTMKHPKQTSEALEIDFRAAAPTANEPQKCRDQSARVLTPVL